MNILPKYGLTNENSGLIFSSALMYVEQMASKIHGNLVHIVVISVEFYR